MADSKSIAGGAPVASEYIVSRDSSLQGDGTAGRPLGVALGLAAQIRVVAHVAHDLSITYTASAIRLAGGIEFGGIDSTIYPGYVLVLLTLPVALDDAVKVPLAGIHLNAAPVGPLGETVFLDIPPIPIQLDGLSASANMLVPIFGKGVADTDETIDVTYRLLVIPP